MIKRKSNPAANQSTSAAEQPVSHADGSAPTTPDAAAASAQTGTGSTGQTIDTGERMYVIGRWVVVAIVLLMGLLVGGVSLWPPWSFAAGLFAPLFWLYVLFSAATTGLLFAPRLQTVFEASVIADIVFLALLESSSGAASTFFLPLYILPLTAIALRHPAKYVLILGGLAGVGYIAAIIIATLVQSIAPTVPEYVAFVVQGGILVALTWLIHSLSQQWQGANNAERQFAYKPGTVIDADQAATFSMVATTLVDSFKGETVLETLLREAHRLVPYTTGLALLPSGNPGELEVAAGHGLSLVDPGVLVQVTQGSLTARALYPPATPQLLEDVSAVPEWQPITTLRECKAACLIPLRSGVEIFGLVLVAREGDQAFRQDEVNVLVALTHYATAALLNHELNMEVKKGRMDMVAAEEHARHWIAREVHDGLAQKLAAIVMNTEFIKRLITQQDVDTDAAVAELDKLHDIFKRANYDVRTLLGELKPTTLETRGLPAALEEYVERLRNTDTNIKYIFEARGVAGMTIAKETQSMLFNIVQESLNNARKYAQARHILLRLEREGYRFTITIRDDGKGFEVEKAKAEARARGSYGLSNLSERAKLVSGVTEIVSEPGKGTMIKVTVPLEV